MFLLRRPSPHYSHYLALLALPGREAVHPHAAQDRAVGHEGRAEERHGHVPGLLEPGRVDLALEGASGALDLLDLVDLNVVVWRMYSKGPVLADATASGRE